MINNLEVSIVKYACPICGKPAEEGILMNSLLTEENAKMAAELNGKTIGYADHACKECTKYKNVVFFIAIDVSKSNNDDVYRTGQISGIKDSSPLVQQVKNYIITLKDGSRYVNIDEKLGKEIGLWK